jgi:Protein of unknown function (DUF1569)
MKFATGNAGVILLDRTIRGAMDSYLEQLQQAIDSALRGMSGEELTRHPEGEGDRQGKWSAAEVLEHLYLTYTGTIKGCERCLQAGKPLASTITLKQRARITLVIGLGYFPKGRKAPERATPKGLSPDKVLPEIGSQIAAMGELIAQCEARYGARTRVLDHPILGPLTTRQWRKFHWVHGRHHVKQILTLRKTQNSSSRQRDVR